jgi:hypothetical protein
MGLEHWAAIQVLTGKIIGFGYKLFSKPDRVNLGVPNPDPNLSSLVFWWGLIHRPVALSSSSFRVFLLTVAFRYQVANCKILRLEHCCLFLMYWPPFQSKAREGDYAVHPENESPLRVNDFWFCICGNLSSNWMQTFINVV